MARRSTRHFGAADRQTLLTAIGECRKACVEALAVEPIGAPLHDRTVAVMQAIDNLAELLTGDREHFWTKPHTIPSTRPE